MRANRRVLVAAIAAVVVLAGCQREAEHAPDGVSVTPAPDVATPDASVSAPVAADASAPQAAPFDVATVQVSDAPLGDWPYVAPAEGYVLQRERTLDLSRVPFWTGQVLQPVEGKVFEARIHQTGEKVYSRFEVLKRFDEALTALGAQKITTSEIPFEVIDADLPKDFGVEFNAGSGGYYPGREVSTYVLRRADRVVWFTLYSDGSSGSLLIAESDVVPTAG